MDTYQDTQQTIQKMIADGSPLEPVLVAICAMIEGQLPDAMSSIMLFDPEAQTLSLIAGGRLPVSFRSRAQHLPVGPNAAFSGRAAYHREPVISVDILEDPRCEAIWDLARDLQLRAAWSYPVLTRNSQLLGTFALYYHTPGTPDESQQEPIRRAAALVALAIERHRDRRALLESEQRYRSLFTHNPDGVFSLDMTGILKSVNRAGAELAGLSPAQAIGMHYVDFVAPVDQDRVNASFERARSGEAQRYEVQIFDASNNLVVLDVTNLPTVVDGEIVGVYGISKDITQRKAQDTQLRILERSVEASVNGIVIADAKHQDLPLVYANERFLGLTGYTMKEVLGRNCRFLNGSGTDRETLDLIKERIAARRDVRVTLLNYRKDGTSFWNDLFVSPVPDETGEITHFVGIQHDVSVQKANEARLDHQASHEPLTGLANRSLFEKRLSREYDSAQVRQGLLAVLYVDLDDFKPINDTRGHAVGDRILRAAARRLSSILASGDTLACLGGDEFVILLCAVEEENQIRAVAERALHVLDKPHRIDGQDIHVTGSIGIAVNGDSVKQPIEMIQHADMAMYLAKQSGRNTYHWYTQDMTHAMNERESLRLALHEAILNNQFELYYQPLIDATTEAVEGFEALIRWHHSAKGLVSPATFIPLAEQTGQIIAIGEWVMNRACADLVELNRSRDSNYRVAINVSPLQFHERNFLNTLTNTLAKSGLSAYQLGIEMTEGVLMENTESAIDILHTLRGMGTEVFIDDFGTGFSSLSYLKHLPISKIKIDRTFTREITTDPHDDAIAQGIITMAHNLRLEVVAEGIETVAQRDLLAARGCDLFQGYLFAKPMPIDQLHEYLSATTPA